MRKKLVLADVFNQCKQRNNFIFDNDVVRHFCKKRGFGNIYDATKVDNSSILPDVMREDDYFLLHLGGGRHQFIKGISNGFHEFEEIRDKKNWEYKKSILNEFDTSESNILSLGLNQKIIHDFLYEDITANPKIYMSRRTKSNLSYIINEQHIEATKVQMEIDLTLEQDGKVIIFEAKNGFPLDFSLYQIFNPYCYYYNLQKTNKLKINEIACCYLLRKTTDEDSILRFYKYTFSNNNDMASISLQKSKEYVLIPK